MNRGTKSRQTEKAEKGGGTGGSPHKHRSVKKLGNRASFRQGFFSVAE